MKKLLVIAAAMLLFVCAGNAQEKAVRVISEAEFKAEVEDFSTDGWKFLGDSPVVVDFYADWCPPCRRLAPVLESVAKGLVGKVSFLKVNVDNASALAGAYGISSIPTLLFIKADGTHDFITGFMDEETLKEAVKVNCGIE